MYDTYFCTKIVANAAGSYDAWQDGCFVGTYSTRFAAQRAIARAERAMNGGN